MNEAILDEIAPTIRTGLYTPPPRAGRRVVKLNHRYVEGIYA